MKILTRLINSKQTEEVQYEMQMSNMCITGTGRLIILNGGSSAAEGGMGSGSKSETEQGDVKPQTGKSNDKSADTESENTFDPVKKDIDKKQKE